MQERNEISTRHLHCFKYPVISVFGLAISIKDPGLAVAAFRQKSIPGEATDRSGTMFERFHRSMANRRLAATKIGNEASSRYLPEGNKL